MIVPDNETAVDLLYYESVARTLVRLLEKKPDEPITVGVHGDWGAGKSSVLMMVEETLKGDDRVLCVRFNGWLFQGYADAKAVLIETIVSELLQSRSGVAKVTDQAKKVLRRVDWMKVAKKVGGVAFTVASGIPAPNTVKDLFDSVTKATEKAAEDLTVEDFKEMATEAGSFLKAAESETVPEQIHAFREDFQELLELAEIDRLVVLVDDLDRCLPLTAIETLEAIRLFLFVPRAAFVIAADEGMIEYAVRQHFPDLPVAAGPATYARNYLEKLVQVPFRLPSLGYAETRIYLTLLLATPDLGEKSDDFQKLIDVARDALRQPWSNPGLDRTAVSEALGEVSDAVEHALTMAHNLAQILTDGARGNPRQIKRFINTMSLRQAIADERGFGAELVPQVLAKIMLAEWFAPEMYAAIARDSAASGRSELLAALEKSVRQERKPAKSTGKAKSKKAAAVKQPPLPDLPNIEWAKQWAKIDPSLATLDLRPYVFLTRDRRGTFSTAPTLDHLDDLVLRLSASDMAVAQASSQVANLPAPDAEQVFDALRSKFASINDLSVRPNGIRGIAEVCKHHPFLRPSFISLLKSLPVAKLGPWVTGGWSDALNDDESRAGFQALMNEWSTQDENASLQTAAKAATAFHAKAPD